MFRSKRGDTDIVTDTDDDIERQNTQRARRRGGYMVFYGRGFDLRREVAAILGPLETRVEKYMSGCSEQWRDTLVGLVNRDIEDHDCRRELLLTVAGLFETTAGRALNGAPAPWDGAEPLITYYLRAVEPLIQPLHAALAEPTREVVERLTNLCRILDGHATRVVPLLRKHELAMLHAENVKLEQQEAGPSDY